MSHNKCRGIKQDFKQKLLQAYNWNIYVINMKNTQILQPVRNGEKKSFVGCWPLRENSDHNIVKNSNLLSVVKNHYHLRLHFIDFKKCQCKYTNSLSDMPCTSILTPWHGRGHQVLVSLLGVCSEGKLSRVMTSSACSGSFIVQSTDKGQIQTFFFFLSFFFIHRGVWIASFGR